MLKKISNLLNKIEAPDVRFAIESEFSRLKNHKKFGLVFENHKPEVLSLWKKKPQRGDYVALKDSAHFEIWKVLSIKSNIATLIKDELAKNSSSTNEIDIGVDSIVVVKRFGDPIYPALTHIGSVEGKKVLDKTPKHTLIEADNYHALQLLRYIYKGKADCIYIDPPYNTGARDWKYNNDYVDLNDAWRHSKWLSFMQKRLELARDLLNPKSSVLIVTIDEHEVHHLACLLDEMFPNSRRQMVTIVNNGAGVSQGGFYRVDEYALFCFIGDAKPNAGSDDMLSDEKSEPLTPIWFSLIRYGGVNAVPSKRDNLVYPIGIDPITLKIVGTGLSLRDRVNNGSVARATDDWLPSKEEKYKEFPVVWPFRGNGKMATWQVKPETLMELQQAGFVRVRHHKAGPGGNQFSISYVKSGNRAKIIDGTIPTIGRESSGALILGQSARNVIPKTVWRRARHDAGKWGSRVLRENLGDVVFDYAKSPYAVLDCLAAAVSHKQDALILDFFAGSGTTLLATLLLNERDQGRRQCILVTNNEVSIENSNLLTIAGMQPGDVAWENKGVCKSVTWPRAKNTILGTNSDGTPLSGEYFDSNLLEREISREVFQLSFAEGPELSSIMRKDLLKLIDGVSGSDLKDKSFCVSKNGLIAVVFDDMDIFLEELEDFPNIEKVFIVTKNKSGFKAAKEAILEELGPKLVTAQREIPMSRGFPASLDYYKLDFLDPGTVGAGQAFSAILPILWMMSGCIGDCPQSPLADDKWLLEKGSFFSVLMKEKFFIKYLENLSNNLKLPDNNLTDSLRYIFLVTDEDDSFNVWRRQLMALPWKSGGAKQTPIVIQLYKNYLDNFRLQVNTTRRGN
jgi:adenine-specific DNA-methyltransferase